MLRKLTVLLMAALFSVSVAGLSFAAEEKKQGATPATPATPAKPAENPCLGAGKGEMKTEKKAKKKVAKKKVKKEETKKEEKKGATPATPATPPAEKK